MNSKSQVDKWLHKLKNIKIIAFVVILFIVSLAGMKWINEFHKFKDNYSDTEVNKDSNSIIEKDENYIVSEGLHSNENNPKPRNEGMKKVYTQEFSSISGRLLDEEGHGIFNGVIIGEYGEKVSTDENGYFELEIQKRPNQKKVKIFYSKHGLGEKERYVGINQTNIRLKL